MRRYSGHFRWLLLVAALTGLFGITLKVTADETGSIAYSSLPPEAQTTLALIKQGGPFPYPRKDGSIFNNFEKRLPARDRGYYQEYTVPTPGYRDRGPRRIIAGKGKTGDVKNSGEYYYTEDHYRHFKRIQ